MKPLAAAIMASSALAVATAPMVAAAQEHHRHRVQVCRDVSSRGARNTGTAVGAVAGGVIGHQVAKHNATHRRCHYEWRD